MMIKYIKYYDKFKSIFMMRFIKMNLSKIKDKIDFKRQTV